MEGKWTPGATEDLTDMLAKYMRDNPQSLASFLREVNDFGEKYLLLAQKLADTLRWIDQEIEIWRLGENDLTAGAVIKLEFLKADLAETLKRVEGK